MAEFPQVKALFDEALDGLSRPERAKFRQRLYEAANTNTSTVGRWFMGKQRPDRDSWGAIATVAKMPLSKVAAACSASPESGVTRPELDALKVALAALGQAVLESGTLSLEAQQALAEQLAAVQPQQAGRRGSR